MEISFFKKVVNIKSYKTISLFLHSAIVLAISYIITLCFVSSTKSLTFFAVLEESDDIPMSDMYLYINSGKGPAKLDTKITLVSIDSCKDRFEIAQLIQQIDSLQPEVIGLDVFFMNRKEPNTDTVLENVIRKSKNLVTACILDDEQREDKDKYNTCNRNFFAGQENGNFTEGFINLDSDGFSSIRTFTPKLFWQKKESLDTLYCFAAQIVRLYDETAFKKLLQRAGNLEIINFQPLRFYEIEKNEINDNPELITGKIVLIGSLSEDLHKTPVNPQMQGMEIHAQIISTILEGKYINSLDNIWTKLINILFCYLFALFSWFVTARIEKGVVILVKLAQVAILLLAFFTGYYLFNHYNIDIAYARSIIVMSVVVLIVDIYHVVVTFGSKFIRQRKKINQYEKDNI